MIVVTHVQKFGPFLKIYGHVDHVLADVQMIQEELNNVWFSAMTKLPPPDPRQLSSLAMYVVKNVDGDCFRVKYISMEQNNEMALVYFIDFGYDAPVLIAQMRILIPDYDNAIQYLLNEKPVVSEYILARVMHNWEPRHISQIRNELCNKTGVEMAIADQVGPYTLIDVFFNTLDYSAYLVNKGISLAVPLKDQCESIARSIKPSIRMPRALSAVQQQNDHPINSNILVRNNLSVAPQRMPIPSSNISPASKKMILSHLSQRAPIPRQMHHMNIMPTQPSYGVNRHPIDGSYSSHSTVPAPAATNFGEPLNNFNNLNQTTLPIFISNSLTIGSVHQVYCSYIEDGPNIFTIHLKSREQDLDKLMSDLGNVQLQNLTKKPMVGMACVARYSEDRSLYRAVIMNVMPTSCLVSYVDYGNKENVNYQDIYEILPQFLQQPTFGLRFTLSGCQTINPLNDNTKSYFADLIMDKELTLKVMPLDGPVFIQYCELEVNGQNILKMLQESMNKNPQYVVAEKLSENDLVVIRFVDSPKKFFVQKIDNIQTYEQMMDRLLIYCQDPTTATIQKPKVGMACASKFNLDSEWYRVEILQFNSTKALVSFVDFGIRNKVELKDLKVIGNQFLALPKQAVECCLYLLQNYELTDMSRDQLELLAEDSAGHRRNFKVNIIGGVVDNVTMVNLTDDTVKPTLDLSSRVLKLNLPPSSYRYFEQQRYSKQPPKMLSITDEDIVNSTSIDGKNSISNDGRYQKNPKNYIPNLSNDSQSSNCDETSQYDAPNNRPNDTSNWESTKNNGRNAANDTSMWESTKNSVRKGPNDTSNWESTKNGGGRPNDTTMWESTKNSNRNFTGNESRNQQQRISNNNETSNWDDSRQSQHHRQNETSNWDTTNSSGINVDNNNSRKENRRSGSWSDEQPQQPSYAGNSTQWTIDHQEQRWSKRDDKKAPQNDKRDRHHFSVNKIKNSIPRFNKQNNNLNNVLKGRDNRNENNFSRSNETKYAQNNSNSSSSGHFSKSSNRSSEENESSNNGEAEDCIDSDYQLNGPLVNLSEKYDVSVSWWTSPLEFYVNLNDNLSDFETMMKNMQKSYKNKSPKFDKATIGSYVVALQQRSNVFYRAQILDYNEQVDKYKINFIDVGQKAIVTLDNIWDMEKRFTKLPKIAIPCKIGSIVFLVDKKEIQDQIDRYFENKSLKCEFLVQKNQIYNVSIDMEGSDLKESLINDNLLAAMPDEIDLSRLVGQTITTTIVNIQDLSQFKCKLFGYDNFKFTCAYNEFRAIKDNRRIQEEFKTNYENKLILAKITDLSCDNVILMSPLITCLTNKPSPIVLSNFPVLSNCFNVTVTHVESMNCVYVQNVCHSDVIAEFLDDLYNYYETKGDPCRDFTPYRLCVAKSADENWYRCHIVAAEPNNQIKVRYIDYGNCEIVPSKNLKSLTTEFMEKFNVFALKVYLPLRNVDCHSENVIDVVKELTKGYPLNMEISESYGSNWIVDLKSNNYSLIQLLKDEKKIADYMDLTELKRLIDEHIRLEQPFIGNDVQLVERRECVAEEPPVENRRVEEEPVENTVQSSPAPIPKAVVVPDTIDAFISHVDNPDRFYLQLKSEQNDLDQLSNNLQIVAASLPMLSDFSVGTQCIVKYSADENWYRAVIMDSDSEITSIQFIDYGNTDTITNNAYIKEMNEAFSHDKKFAFLCSLPMEPKDGNDWPDDASTLLREISDDMVKFEYIVKSEEKNFVKLYVDDRDILQELIVSNIGTSMGVIKNNEKCYVSHCNSIEDFYIQVDSDTEGLEIMTLYLAEPEQFKPLSEFVSGTICIAQFEDDDLWYRAKIIDENVSGGGVKVFFVDYGNTSIVKNIRELGADIAPLKHLSIHCALRRAGNIECWSEEAEQKFQEIAASGETTFTVNLCVPGKVSIIDLLCDNRNIAEDLIPLCPLKNIITLLRDDDDVIIDHNYTKPAPETVTTEIVKQKANICLVISPSEFYCHLNCNDSAVNRMLDEMESGESFSRLEAMSVGQVCVAKFSEDDCYYRAEILNINEEHSCEVLFIDYGNKEYCSDIRQLPEHLENIEKLALQCSLEIPDDFAGQMDLIGSKFVDKFSKYLDEEIEIEIVGTTSAASSSLVRIYQNGKNIFELLASEDNAIVVEPSDNLVEGITHSLDVVQIDEVVVENETEGVHHDNVGMDLILERVDNRIENNDICLSVVNQVIDDVTKEQLLENDDVQKVAAAVVITNGIHNNHIESSETSDGIAAEIIDDVVNSAHVTVDNKQIVKEVMEDVLNDMNQDYNDNLNPNISAELWKHLKIPSDTAAIASASTTLP